jgi:uncharacterized protein YyaL (SSP411 family)
MNRTNRLANEKSPYLLQHASNPVDWFPWGEEAFGKAREEQKLIFLSIGYSTCHWCHVMERESFQDEMIALFLNENFIPIKLDREERPDVDKIYMDAIQAMNQQGGWPLNIFLTPELYPLTGGTYFPPVPRYGMRSFSDVLRLVLGYWTEKRKEMRAAAGELADYLRKSVPNQSDFRYILDDSVFHNTRSLYEKYFDPVFFGFKTNSQNKFPPTMSLLYLLAYNREFPNPDVFRMVELSLYAMRRGGIYDQINGGLFRYSTDHEWKIPHFEKMLYDNALLLRASSEAYQVCKDSIFQEMTENLADYLLNNLRLETGGFASAEDADSEGVEGKFYLWTQVEIQELLSGLSKKNEIQELWNIRKEGNFGPNNHLYESVERPRQAEILRLGGKDFEAEVDSAIKILRENRSQRQRPFCDEKVILSWNSLLIQSLLYAGLTFQKDIWIQEAIKTYRFLREKFFYTDGIYRRYFMDSVGIPGTLTDYAEFGRAGFALFCFLKEEEYLEDIQKVYHWILEKFASPQGAFYETDIQHSSDLIFRPVTGYDGVEPSGNSALVSFFLEYQSLGFESGEVNQYLENIFQTFSRDISSNGISYPYMLAAYLKYQKFLGAILIIQGDGRQEEEKAKEIYSRLTEEFLPGKTILKFSAKEFKNYQLRIPILDGIPVSEKTSVFICKNQTCSPPVKSWPEISEILFRSNI